MRRRRTLHGRNPGEATYIAQLLRGLLTKDAGLCIGIVAFSVAQQGKAWSGSSCTAR